HRTFKYRLLHALPIIDARLRDPSQPPLPLGRDRTHVVCHQHLHEDLLSGTGIADSTPGRRAGAVLAAGPARARPAPEARAGRPPGGVPPPACAAGRLPPPSDDPPPSATMPRPHAPRSP